MEKKRFKMYKKKNVGCSADRLLGIVGCFGICDG